MKFDRNPAKRSILICRQTCPRRKRSIRHIRNGDTPLRGTWAGKIGTLAKQLLRLDLMLLDKLGYPPFRRREGAAPSDQQGL
ncbi:MULTISPECIES: hypothetical protein [Sphingopyxis]|jgi:hypothetical protein|uniref:hypothetical protein n=1 Tax=Sphingopyxis TaxID=165697 RepID=UPI00118182D9